MEWTEKYRWVTPVMLMLLNIIAGGIVFQLTDLRHDVAGIDTKLFHHLTNDELHILRRDVVQKVEFDRMCELQRDERTRIFMAIGELKDMMYQAIPERKNARGR